MANQRQTKQVHVLVESSGRNERTQQVHVLVENNGRYLEINQVHALVESNGRYVLAKQVHVLVEYRQPFVYTKQVHVLVENNGNYAAVIQNFIYVEIREEETPVRQCVPIPLPTTTKSTAAAYYCVIKNQAGERVALLDNWISLEFGQTVNDVDIATLVLDANDSRVSLFEVDGQFEVWRSVPGVGLDWTLEFEGFYRSSTIEISENGEYTYTAEFLSYNDLLARTIVGYKGGTICADKNAPAETAMKEYVYENCGAGADTITYVGRPVSGVIPNFSVDTNTALGEVWTGSKPFENLLDVLKEIALVSGIDFGVVGNGDGKFLFKTYFGQLGTDRSTTGYDPLTGLNAAGNAPVIFSVENANIARISFGEDRRSEINTVYVLGKSELSTKVVRVRQNSTAVSLSPFNRREASRPSQNSEFQYQLDQFGDEALISLGAKENLDFVPLQQPDCMYGLHYKHGDRVEIRVGTKSWQRRIYSVFFQVDDKGESISIKFEDAV